MGRFCLLCEGIRPSHKFGRSGNAASVCRDCRQEGHWRPRVPVARQLDFLRGVPRQQAISQKNIDTLRAWIDDPNADGEVRRRAQLLLEVAVITPLRKRRWSRLWAARPDLVRRCVAEEMLDVYSESLDFLDSEEVLELHCLASRVYDDDPEEEDDDPPPEDGGRPPLTLADMEAEWEVFGRPKDAAR